MPARKPSKPKASTSKPASTGRKAPAKAKSAPPVPAAAEPVVDALEPATPDALAPAELEGDEEVEAAAPAAAPVAAPATFVPPKLPAGMNHVVIIGRTPGGLAAAIRIARRGLGVCVLDPGTDHPVGLSSDLTWTSTAGVAALADLQLPKPLAWSAPAKVHFTTGTVDKSVALDTPPGAYLIETDALLDALAEAAEQAGAKCRKAVIERLQLKDDQVVVQTRTGAPVTGCLLIHADDSAGQNLLDVARLRTPLQGLRPSWTLYRLTRSGKGETAPTLVVVIGWRGSHQLGSAWWHDGHGVLALPENDPVQSSEAAALVAAMVKSNLLPAGTRLDAGSAQRRRFAPASSLEFDQHFGKRCILVGQSGGFSAALSGEALYAGVRSASIAADLCLTALENRHPQDVLSQFEMHWRSTLADYLRLPNTDLQFILPVVFTNPQMAAKIAAGFINGENL